MKPSVLKSALFSQDRMIARLKEELAIFITQREAILLELRRTCEHKEVVQRRGVAVTGFTTEDIDLHTARRMCKFCGLKEFGRLADFYASLEEYIKVLKPFAITDITADYVFSRLGSPDKIENVSEDDAIWNLEIPA